PNVSTLSLHDALPIFHVNAATAQDDRHVVDDDLSVGNWFGAAPEATANETPAAPTPVPPMAAVPEPVPTMAAAPEPVPPTAAARSEEHTSELQSRENL